MRVRRAIPWIASFSVHAALVIAAARILSVSPPVSLPPPAVEVQLVAQPGGSARGAAQRGANVARAAAPRATPRRALPTSTRVLPQRRTSGTRGVLRCHAAPALDVAPFGGQQGDGGEATLPSTQDVLSDLAATAPPADAAASVGEGGSIGWQGTPRTLIRRRDPQFPVLLSAAGQEVELQATITVAPSGVVTRVEITRSSGYTDVDASVEAALRDYLFSRVNGRLDAVGTVRFRFRLEKLD